MTTSTLSRSAALLVAASCISTVLAQGWNQRHPTSPPPATNSAAMVYDVGRSVMVLFGGSLGSGSSDQTWEYDGLDWRQVMTATKPSPRYGQAMVYDQARGRTVLFGGYGATSGGSNDTWEYDGSSWTSINASNPPSLRAGSKMVYDARAQRMVLLGGASGNSYYNDTWEYDGVAQAWTAISNAGKPDQSIQFAMVYDLIRGKTIAFGGVNTSFTLLNSVWEYDGTAKTWAKVAVNGTMPAVRRLVNGAFDLGRAVMVVHGGDKLPGELSDTWEYDGLGQTWTDKTVPGTGPVLNREYCLAFDVRRATTVLWGGITNNVRTNWTWEYGLRGTFVSFGHGCPGHAAIGVPALTALSAGPIVGETMDTQVAPAPGGGFMIVGFSNQRHQSGLPLPIDLTPVGANGCLLYVSTEIVLPLSSMAGVAVFHLPVPANPTLSGLEYYQQALVADPGINPIGHVLTNAAEATIL